MSTRMDVEQAVNERYGRAAQRREAELCCPVEYDSKLLSGYCQVNQICAFMTATSGIPEGPRPHSVAVSHERFPLS